MPATSRHRSDGADYLNAMIYRKFKTGDTVFHRPTGETWVLIKDEQDGYVTPGGWPPSQGRSEDCKLVDKAEDINPTPQPRDL